MPCFATESKSRAVRWLDWWSVWKSRACGVENVWKPLNLGRRHRFADRIVGWKLSNSQTTDFVLDALEQALVDRDVAIGELIHHSDRGSQYVSVAYTERLADAGIKPSVGSVGDSYDNALAETINGLYKTELVYNLGPWKSKDALELATMKWIHWYNHERLLGAIGYVSPAEYETLYNLSKLQQDKAAWW